ncbi:MAG TPA: exopolyphosphatase [Alphaproteobacteria bacterium]|nr:exopolyphosphatase [Alphaproteobacteria bacterium]
MIAQKRLLTRCDFDGLVCAALLKELGLIDEIRFVHPKDMQDGRISISNGDITANLPYVEGVYIAFDHHISENARVISPPNYIVYPNSPSAARVVYEYYGAENRFKDIPAELMKAVDNADSARYTVDQIKNPTDWTLLAFITDPRTGLGRFKNFRIGTYEFMLKLVDLCRTHPINEILNDPDVKERVDLYFSQQEKFKEQLKRQTTVYKNLAYIDMLNEDVIYAGNRFMVYALFPEVNVSMHAMWRVNGQRIVYAVGKSIFNRTNIINIGELLLGYGGGGHANVGTCQIDLDKAAQVKDELIAVLTDPQYTEQPQN